jgi:large subunit ribosomal protein L29
MASKKFLELKEFTIDELKNELAETKTQYSKMKFDHALKGLENGLQLRYVRKDIARMNTEVRRRELVELDNVAASRTKIVARRKRQKKA